MKLIASTFLLVLTAGGLFAQSETFDLVTYTAPKDWSKEVIANSVSYTFVNKTNSTWCQIRVMKSTASKGSIDADFESEWNELIAKNYNPSGTRQLNAMEEANGWKKKAAVVKFVYNGIDAMAMLVTATGFERCVSVIVIVTGQDYFENIKAFLSSVVFTDMSTEGGHPVAGLAPPTPVNSNAPSLIGTWGISMVTPYRSGTESIAGSTLKQYTFNANGTFTFYSKTFKYNYNKLLLIRENGTYQINGNSITITPQNSAIEAWSKKDDTSEWGMLVSSDKRKLEKVTYQFTMDYSSGLQKWNLLFQANAPTDRDGPFMSSSTHSNAWLYSPKSANELIKLPN